MTPRDMPQSDQLVGFEDLSPEMARNIDETADCFEHQLYTQGRPQIESFLGGFHEPERSILLRELLLLELETYLSRGAFADHQAYLRRFPNHRLVVNEVFNAIFPSNAPAEPVIEGSWPNIPNYRILRQIGQGGMGTVYEAIHVSLATRVALKVMRKDLARNLEAEADFEREMRVIGTLAHPNVVAARDAGKSEGQRYLVMEYVEGLDLLGILQRLGPLPVCDVCEVTRRVAFALEGARQHNLVHRDIKPKNVLLGRVPSNAEEVEVKVADFGLAALRGYTLQEDVATSTKRVVGTFSFMAPEQFWEHESDIRSDIYSLGCTCYCLLLGRPPFSRPRYQNSDEIMKAHRDAPIPPVRVLRPDVSDELETAIQKMLAKKPQDRFQSPAELAESLLPFANRHDLPALLSRAEASPSPAEAAQDFVPHVHTAPKKPVERAAALELSETDSFVLEDRSTVSEGRFSGATEEACQQSHKPPKTPEHKQQAFSNRLSTGYLLLTLVAVLGVVVVALAVVFRKPAPIDLLSSLNLQSTGVEGDWTYDDRTLISPNVPYARCPLECSVPAQYELVIEAERVSGGRLVIGLFWRGRQIPVVVDAAFAVMDSEDLPHEQAHKSSTTEDFGFHGGQPLTYTCIVSRKGILVAYENEIRFLFRSDRGPLPLDTEWQTGDGTVLFLGTHNSVFRFRKIVLTPRRG
jgi:serine/threonine protein kinase